MKAIKKYNILQCKTLERVALLTAVFACAVIVLLILSLMLVFPVSIPERF